MKFKRRPISISMYCPDLLKLGIVKNENDYVILITGGTNLGTGKRSSSVVGLRVICSILKRL